MYQQWPEGGGCSICTRDVVQNEVVVAGTLVVGDVLTYPGERRLRSIEIDIKIGRHSCSLLHAARGGVLSPGGPPFREKKKRSRGTVPSVDIIWCTAPRDRSAMPIWFSGQETSEALKPDNPAFKLSSVCRKAVISSGGRRRGIGFSP